MFFRGVNESNGYIPHANYFPNIGNQRFPNFRSEFHEDQWFPMWHKTGRFFVRKQSRNDPKRRDVHENDIALHDLEREFNNLGTESSVFCHATSWESAIKKVEEGPQMSEGPLDLAYYGAFYLNPCYRDCHDWFYTRDSKFQGKHAMLIFKLHPESLSKKGKQVLDIKRWRSLAGERSQSTGKFEDDWTYTYQNSDPDHVHKSGDNAKIRKTRDGQQAMQLIIYTEKMCTKIYRHLMGCVYYENCNSSVNQGDISNQIQDGR